VVHQLTELALKHMHRLPVGRGQPHVCEVQHAMRPGVDHHPVVVPRTRTGDLCCAGTKATSAETVHQGVNRRCLARVHGGAEHGDGARTDGLRKLRHQAEIGEIQGAAPFVPDQPHGRDVGRIAHISAAAEHRGGDAPRGHELGTSQVRRHVGLELVRCVTVAVDDDDLVPVVQHRSPAVRLFDPSVVPQTVHAGKDKVARTGTHATGDQCAHCLPWNPASREAGFRLETSLRMKQLHQDASTSHVESPRLR